MNRCSICNEWMFTSLAHHCPPAFTCEPIGDYAGYGGDAPVHALDAEEAARKFADQWDADMEYPLMRGAELVLKVTDLSGNVTLCEVTGESVPSYYVHAMSDERAARFLAPVDRSGEAIETRSGSTVGESAVTAKPAGAQGGAA
jgi:hypothetical protein